MIEYKNTIELVNKKSEIAYTQKEKLYEKMLEESLN